MDHKALYTRLVYDTVAAIAFGTFGEDIDSRVIDAGLAAFDKYFRMPHTLEYAKMQAKLEMQSAAKETQQATQEGR